MKTQWQIYQQLELIPDTVSFPSPGNKIPAFYKGGIWRKVVDSCTKNLSEQQKIDHLQTCFQLDYSDPHLTEKFHFFQTIWQFLNQPIKLSELLTSSTEPYVWTSSMPGGYIQWHIYDPKSGNTYDLNSEEEVLGWLEHRNSN